ncbi:hypothetical protein [Streptomyces sp. NRRL B-24484]|uniref:hypothetical protein n=1 Tax=Streptomyces sp. NRRL B-24484 TaxID=1463833 RepID=UPI0004C03CDF|nr:hypothetical protein [Streptomyces sp. NRRL B-24484]
MEQVVREVAAEGGSASYTVGELRDLVGAGRTSRQVAEKISNLLHRYGLRHLPSTIPADQNRTVLVFDPEQAKGILIQWVLEAESTDMRKAQGAVVALSYLLRHG